MIHSVRFTCLLYKREILLSMRGKVRAILLIILAANNSLMHFLNSLSAKPYRYLLTYCILTHIISINLLAQNQQYTKVKPQGVIVYDSILSKSNFRDSTFQDETDFSGIVFENGANFNYSQFKSLVSFDNTWFVEYAGFWGSKFCSKTEFDLAIFMQGAEFGNGSFHSPVSFNGAEFRSWAHIYGKFDSTASFEKAKFKSLVDFGGFSSLVSFKKTVFDSTANFEYFRVF